MSCYKACNNKHFNCPPEWMMVVISQTVDLIATLTIPVRANNATLNSHEYRMFLTHNATKLMDLNRTYTTQKNGCGPCMKPYNTGTMLPEQTVQVCNNKSCNTDFVNDTGLGLRKKIRQ